MAGIPERYARYSHTEILFSTGECFSSSETDGGCRFKMIAFKEENWDFVEIPTTPEQEEKIMEFCEFQNGNRYNKVGIFFAQILNFNKKKNGTWFCSEITTRAFQEI